MKLVLSCDAVSVQLKTNATTAVAELAEQMTATLEIAAVQCACVCLCSTLLLVSPSLYTGRK